MHIVVNGVLKNIPESTSLLDVIKMHDLSPDTVVVEYNSAIISAAAYGSTFLAENDNVELLQFVGGG